MKCMMQSLQTETSCGYPFYMFSIWGSEKLVEEGNKENVPFYWRGINTHTKHGFNFVSACFSRKCSRPRSGSDFVEMYVGVFRPHPMGKGWKIGLSTEPWESRAGWWFGTWLLYGLGPENVGLIFPIIYSHLIGIMIINYWVQWGTQHFQTHPYAFMIFYDFPFSWEWNNHPNWQILFRGVGIPTNQRGFVVFLQKTEGWFARAKGWFAACFFWEKAVGTSLSCASWKL